MGDVTIWQWLVTLTMVGCTIWFLVSTAKLLSAAGLSAAWVVLVILLPFFGTAIVQSMIAKRLSAHR